MVVKGHKGGVGFGGWVWEGLGWWLERVGGDEVWVGRMGTRFGDGAWAVRGREERWKGVKGSEERGGGV